MILFKTRYFLSQTCVSIVSWIVPHEILLTTEDDCIPEGDIFWCKSLVPRARHCVTHCQTRKREKKQKMKERETTQPTHGSHAVRHQGPLPRNSLCLVVKSRLHLVLVEWWLAEGSPSRRTYPFLKANKISERLVLSSTPQHVSERSREKSSV